MCGIISDPPATWSVDIDYTGIYCVILLFNSFIILLQHSYVVKLKPLR